MMRIPDNCTVRLTDRLPLRVGGFVAESPDGHLNIYLNARLAAARQRRSLDHELDHIRRGDLHSGRPICEIEAVHRRAPGLLGIPGLRRASDLLPPEPPKPAAAPLTEWQKRILVQCLMDLDARCSRADPVYLW